MFKHADYFLNIDLISAPLELKPSQDIDNVIVYLVRTMPPFLYHTIVWYLKTPSVFNLSHTRCLQLSWQGKTLLFYYQISPSWKKCTRLR